MALELLLYPMSSLAVAVDFCQIVASATAKDKSGNRICLAQDDVEKVRGRTN